MNLLTLIVGVFVCVTLAPPSADTRPVSVSCVSDSDDDYGRSTNTGGSVGPNTDTESDISDLDRKCVPSNKKHDKTNICDQAGYRKYLMGKRCQCQTKRKHSCDADSCLTWFYTEGLDVAFELYNNFKMMHKLDQDRAIFDQLRSFGLSQSVLVDVGGSVTKGTAKTLSYYVLGKHVCQSAFTSIWSIGWYPRGKRIYDAVMSGMSACPIDCRYLTRVRHATVSKAWGEAWSHLEELYNSVAETLPDDSSDIEGDDVDQEFIEVLEYKRCEPITSDIKRHLPPGSIYELWRQYRELGGPGGYKLFRNVFVSDFEDKLSFRTKRQHSVCPVCIKHKMLLKTFGHDSAARNRQRLMYDQHLKNQYSDRRVYWSLRASSRLWGKTICLIIDGIDQAKFAWPRADFMSNHEFDDFNRPRLHVWGVIVHGFFTLYTVSHADVNKGSSMTCDVIAYVLTRLDRMGIDLSDCHIHVQLDNTASCNKNNTVLQFMGVVVFLGLVAGCTANFLRVGHTHEDIDQAHGEVAKRLKRDCRRAKSIWDFRSALYKILRSLNRPHENIAEVCVVNRVRNWKDNLCNLNVQVSGIGGPTAPKVFEFVKRKGLQHFVRVSKAIAFNGLSTPFKGVWNAS
jgi:hypothetical protein